MSGPGRAIASRCEGRRGWGAHAELGAGAGLVGCLAAQLCPVVLTDGSDTVVQLLRRNAALTGSSHGGALPQEAPLPKSQAPGRPGVCRMLPRRRMLPCRLEGHDREGP